MKIGSPVDAHEPMAEINITPLTDVFLVLLIIFMVTTPLIMSAGLKIKMPKTEALPSLNERDVIIALTSDNRVFVNDAEIPRERLTEYLKELDVVSKLVVVQADQDLPHRVVVAALDAAKMAGAEKLAIATQPVGRGMTKSESVTPVKPAATSAPKKPAAKAVHKPTPGRRKPKRST
jgi:biopolymer transport protein ExbD